MFKLPFKPGNDLWCIDDDTCEIKCEKGGIAGVAIMADGEIRMVGNDGYAYPIGDCDCYPTYEMALTRQKELLKK